ERAGGAFAAGISFILINRITGAIFGVTSDMLANEDAFTHTLFEGMKQKLGIALALLNHPSIVILDEPMNGLDPQATRDVRKIITD
uniref:ATP-binding cassette domain-containing protein n=1 Tax=Enterococcus faecium TaxID=1352 RepID=UPI0039774DB9